MQYACNAKYEKESPCLHLARLRIGGHQEWRLIGQNRSPQSIYRSHWQLGDRQFHTLTTWCFSQVILTIIICNPDGSMFNVYLCVHCCRSSLCHKVLDFQCQPKILCCFQTHVTIYRLIIAYSVMMLSYMFISYCTGSQFLFLIVWIS